MRALVKVILPVALAFVSSITTADEPGAAAIRRWQANNQVVIPPAVQAQLLSEVNAVVARIKQSPSLGPKYNDAAMERALMTYLENNRNSTQSQALLTLVVEELSPGGTGLAYPTLYPVLNLTATFMMTGVVHNGDTISFKPAKSVELLLRLGANEIATRGGESADCRYSIVAQKGQHFAKTCP